MNKQELTQLVTEILTQMHTEQPQVKGSEYKPATTGPQPERQCYEDGDFVPDVTALDLRKLYLTEHAAAPEAFKKLKHLYLYLSYYNILADAHPNVK